jgi:hypothetical protein
LETLPFLVAAALWTAEDRNLTIEGNAYAYNEVAAALRDCRGSQLQRVQASLALAFRGGCPPG